MTKKDDMAVPQALPPKIKDPGSSINSIPLNKVKELKEGEITPSNMILTLTNSSVTQPLRILRDILVHVDGLVLPVDFMVLDTKGDSGGSVILGCPFLAIVKAKIDVDIGELILKFNKEIVIFNVCEWTSYMEDLDTCYHMEEKIIRDLPREELATQAYPFHD
ncbi:uncharacterized protein LOC127103250 [Lathyrus oleraceus]|uniref:uncharacterized protein LOC127103250 n=1 Tax=Pisum sativum TaxID=3888 RepID=UPI0021CFF3B9|nr:uncharacterized protein LOC127103250 [Pisum sativum]